MKYLAMIVAGGEPTPEGASEVMQREVEPWVDEMDAKGIRLVGRELDAPSKSATVRVRGGETIVTDGPFAETKEFVAGFDVLECDDLDVAIEVMSKHPCSWFHAIEIRPFWEGLELDERAAAFGRYEDGGRTPYLMTMWMSDDPDQEYKDEELLAECTQWPKDMDARGVQVFGNAIEDVESATMLRVRDGKTLITDGPFAETKEFIAGIDVVYANDRAEAIELAASHPIARYHAVELRPFAVE